MAKSSIHFSIAKSNSEAHNTRTTKLDYILPELEGNFESWSQSSIDEKRKEVARHCRNTSGRKLQKNAEPVREAVVNLQPHHTMDDLKRLAEAIRSRFKVDCFQIHIHRDEGHYDVVDGAPRINHHAHMLFDWQDKEKGTMLKINAKDLSQIQTLVAETLNMERGELRVNSNRERLEAVEYKTEKAKELVQLYKNDAKEALTDYQEIAEDKKKLQQELKALEQKKKTSEQELQDLKQKELQLTKTKEAQKQPLNESSTFLQRILRKKSKPSLNSMKTALMERLRSLNLRLNALRMQLEMVKDIQLLKAKTISTEKNRGNRQEIATKRSDNNALGR